MYSNAKLDDGGLKNHLKDITLDEAGATLMKHQDRVGGIRFIDELGDSYRLITNKYGKPISLGPNALRALSGHEKACIATMFNSHEPKGAGKGAPQREGEVREQSNRVERPK